MKTTRALIFDFDGVIADTNPLHVKTWAMLGEKAGFPLENPDYIGKCGLRTGDVIRKLLQWPVREEEIDSFGIQKEELFREIVGRDGIPAIPGVLDFIARAKALHIPVAIGSSAPPENIVACNAALGLTGVFDAIVSGEDVARGKPAPDIFLRAAAGLGMPPEACLVFEDSPAGVAAAHAAGMQVVGLLTSHTAEKLRDADVLYADFTAFAVDDFV